MTGIREMTASTSEHRRSRWAMAALPTLLVICAACSSADPPVAAGLPGEPNAVVQRVVDGDTLVVETGGTEERVRLIGIDTPESVKPGTEVECYGKEASANTAELLPGGTEVVLERDVEVRDRYDRLLAYVYRASDGVFVNLAMVDQGYAQAAPYPPNEAYSDEFAAATRDARENGRGLWGACGGDDLYG
jgi:micrococcal nuclease